ncbi:hypothetical protein E1264_25020, partial [Actinomadura sp. KC216]|uniref:endonuclease/exonuclease/phosphatase family protein n=1 Tax=Actinomadura sp. KC216 TaxID=2530370 RepID=UPI0010D7865B
MSALLTVATLDLQDGVRLDLVPGLVRQIGRDVDVLVLQEGKGWDRDGQARRFEAEELLRPLGLDRSFLTRSTRGTLHELVFVRSSRLRPKQHWTPDLPDVFHDQVGWQHFRVQEPQEDEPQAGEPQEDEPQEDQAVPELAIQSAQWAHWSGDVRLDAAQKLTRYAAPGCWAIIAGDFNSLWPDCWRRRRFLPGWTRLHREFEPDWSRRPPHKRLHKTLPPGARPPADLRRRLWAWWGGDRLGGRVVSDRRALSVLAEAGFQSAGCLADDMTVTVNAHIDQGQGGRIDHIVLSPALAAAVVPGSYGVAISEVGDQASDHRLVWVTLDLSRALSPTASTRADISSGPSPRWWRSGSRHRSWLRATRWCRCSTAPTSCPTDP